ARSADLARRSVPERQTLGSAGTYAQDVDTRRGPVRVVPAALLVAIVVWIGAQVASTGLGGSDQGVTMGDQALREDYLALLLLLVPLAVVAAFAALRSYRLSSVAPWVCLVIAGLVLLTLPAL
ncbi:MAG: hypothetical protein ACRD07_23075, partial [Acidimicrobiales bacterium]